MSELEQFLADIGVKYTITHKVHKRPAWVSSNIKPYMLTMLRDGKRIVHCHWGAVSGQPTIQTILSVIPRDCPPSFSEFCEDCGLDEYASSSHALWVYECESYDQFFGPCGLFDDDELDEIEKIFTPGSE